MSPSQENSEGGHDKTLREIRDARRERKRQTDREAQRHRRARTRNHVAHLEKTVKDLTEALEKQEKASWPRTLQQQHIQIERLSGVLETVNSLVLQARSFSSSYLNSCSKDLPEIQTRLPCESSAATVSKKREEEAGSLPTPDRIGCSCADAGVVTVNDVSSTVSPPSHHDSHSQQAISPEVTHLRTQLLANNRDKNQNFFELISNALNAIERRLSKLPLSHFENDEDIAIRAVIHGWEAVRKAYELDEGWLVIEIFDECLFNECGPVEKLAMVRLIRAVFVSKVIVSDQLQPKLPPYMAWTQLQLSTDHANIVDYFAWPNFRDLLIISRLNFVPEMWVRRLFSEIQLAWPYDVRDAYNHILADNKYCFSKEFENIYCDLNSWQIRSDGMLRSLLETKPLLGDDITPADAWVDGDGGSADARAGVRDGGFNGTEDQRRLSSHMFDPSTNEMNDLNIFDVFSLME